MNEAIELVTQLSQERKDAMLIAGLARSNDDITNLALLIGANPIKGGHQMRCWAAKHGQIEIIEKFIQEDNWNPTRSCKPFQIAAAEGNKELVMMFLKMGCCPNYAVPYAVENGQTDVLTILMQAGAKVRWNEAIIIATTKGHAKMVDMLINHGAETYIAIPHTIMHGHKNVMEVLIKKGVTINDELVKMAVNNKHYELLAIMLEHVSTLEEFTLRYVRDLANGDTAVLRILKEKFNI